MKKIILIYICMVLAVIIATPITIYEYNYKNPSDDFEYCIRNMPIKNYTNSREGVCFTKEWHKYCYVIAPYLCPNSTIEEKLILLPSV